MINIIYQKIFPEKLHFPLLDRYVIPLLFKNKFSNNCYPVFEVFYISLVQIIPGKMSIVRILEHGESVFDIEEKEEVKVARIPM